MTLTGTGAFTWNRTLVPDALDEFRVPEVLAGPFTARLVARSGGIHLYGNLQDEVRPGDVTPILLELQPTGRVEGTVFRSNGDPAYGAEVVVKTPNGTVTTLADTMGQFGLDGVPAAAVTIEIGDLFSGGVARASGTVPDGGVLALGRLDLDDTPIAVVSVDPPAGTIGVALDQVVTVTFTDPVGGASQGTVFVSDGTTGRSLSPVVAPDGLSLTLSPRTGLWPDATELLVTVTTGITDAFGRHPLQSFTSSFRTVDHSPPEVLSVAPATGAIQVPENAAVLVTFDEPLAASLDPSGLVTLVRAGGSAVPGVVSLSLDRREATFTPAALLAPNARYDVTVNGAVDESGNAQTTPFPSFFITVDTIPPVLTAVAPTPGGWTSSAQPLVRVGVSDAVPGSGVDPLAGLETMALDSTAVAPIWVGGELRFTPPAPLSEGSHRVDASAQDRAGHVGVLAPFTFSVDVTPPGAATVTSPMDGHPVRGSIPLTAVAVDPGTPTVSSRVAEIQVFLDGAGSPFARLFEASSFADTWVTTTAAEGTHVLTAMAVDVAGNPGPVGPPVTVLVDNQVLTVDVLSPAAGSRFRDTVAVRVLTSEPAARVAFSIGAQVVDGSLVADRTYEATLDLVGLPSSDVQVDVVAHGLLGELASATVGIVVDHDPPAPPVAAKIVAEALDAGYAMVRGEPAAVEGLATVEVTNPITPAVVTTAVALDGSFALRILADEGTDVEVVAIDEVGNRSAPPTIVTVENRTTEEGVPLEGLSIWVSTDHGVTPDAFLNVEIWADRSASGNDLSQADDNKRPALITGEFNGWDVVRFDGTNDTLQFGSRLTAVRTVFWVVAESENATSASRSLLGDDANAWRFHGGSGAPGTIWSTAAEATVRSGQTWVNGQIVDGTRTLRPRTMSVISLVTTGDMMASKFGAAYQSAPWWGDLAELLIYDRVLSPGERRAVEGYLVEKYQPYTPTAGTPAITPAGGSFQGSTTVQLATTTSGAEIRYTLDGSEPTEVSDLYTGSLTIDRTTTVKARAYFPGYIESGIATATFVEEGESPVLTAASLLLWLRADAGIATNAGGWITEWRDQSGRNNDAYQTLGVAAPQLVPDAANGLPVMRFDGGDTVRFTDALTTIRTVFWVVSESVAATSASRSLLGDDANAWRFHGGSGAPGMIWSTAAEANVRNGQTWVNGASDERDHDPASADAVGHLAGDDGRHVGDEVRRGVPVAAVVG